MPRTAPVLDPQALYAILADEPTPTTPDEFSLLANRIGAVGLPVWPMHRNGFRPVAARDILGVRELDHFDKLARQAASTTADRSATLHHREGAAMATTDPAWTAAPITRAAEKWGAANVCLGGALTGVGLAVLVVPHSSPQAGTILEPRRATLRGENESYFWFSMPVDQPVHEAVPEIVIGEGDSALRLLLRDRLVPLPPCGLTWQPAPYGLDRFPPPRPELSPLIDAACAQARREGLFGEHPTYTKGKRAYV